MVQIKYDAFDSRTQSWTRVATINPSGYEQGEWYYFGRIPGTDESISGIPPEFSNNTIFPKYRFSLTAAMPQPLDFAIRIPRYGAIIAVSDLEFGNPIEVANTLVPYEETSWGYASLGNYSIPITPDVNYRIMANQVGVTPVACCPGGTNVQEILECLCAKLQALAPHLYIFRDYLDISDQAGVGITTLTVPDNEFVADSLQFYWNGQLLDNPEEFEELDPSAGTFQLNVPIEAGRLQVSYRVAVTF